MSCNHVFHRPCIENYLSKDSECPKCNLSCQLADLRQICFPGKPLKSTLRRDGLSNQYHTRSFSRNLFNDPQSPSVNITSNAVSTGVSNPPRTSENISQHLSEDIFSNVGINNIPNVSQPARVDYREINRMIETSVTRVLQNLNIGQINSQRNPSQHCSGNVQNGAYNSQGINSSQPNQINSGQLANSSSSFSSNFSNYQNDKITSIIQNWGLKFDGTSTGLTVEEFLYRLKSLTIDNFQGDFNIICKNLHILLTGKAREWFWRYRKQVELINWNEFNEAIRFRP